VEALSGFVREGGHGKVRKVRITGLDTVPPYIALAGKMPKTKDLRDQRVEQSVEALVCPLNHAGLIKFFAINSETMEAYTLWWNGGHLGELLDLNKKVSPTCEWHEMHLIRELPEEKQKEVSLFRRHKAKLAWTLVYVTHLLHQSSVLHNDLSPRNILLHYPDYSNEIINIGICDFGITSRINEKAPSHYGYPSINETKKQQKGRWWVAPELFYTYGPPNSDTSIPIMQSRHIYTKQSDSYSVGKLTESMKIGDMDNFDRDTFTTVDACRYFAMKVGQLTNEDPKKRPTCTEVVNLVMGPPWYMKPPTSVLRDSPL
jgi:serine/threonine protein kinase